MNTAYYKWLRGALLFLILLVSTNAVYSQAFVVEYGSVWKYLDDGSDQGTAWRELTFDDSQWAEGPAGLGYNEDEATTIDFGPDPDNKYITYYFRQKFNITGAANATAINCEFQVDDGLIIYLNGHELERLGLPDSVSLDSVNYLTTFEDADVGLFEGQEREEDMVYNLSNSDAVQYLVDGVNVVAVEVHQSEPGSSDIRFHLQVTIDGDGVEVITGVEKANDLLPAEYALSNAYPNPFNPSTAINFSLPEQSNVKLEVFDALGRLVSTLANGQFDAGNYKYNWDASGFTSGIYYYRITANNFVSTNKMMLMK